MNMKRRTDSLPSPKSTKRQRKVPRIVCSDTEKSRAAVELENLRESNYLIKLETEKLKQKKVELENHITFFTEQGKDMEKKAQKMFTFLGTILNPSIVQQVIDSSAEAQEYESHESVKKMWLIAPKTTAVNLSTECSAKVLNNNNNLNGDCSQDNPPEKQTNSSTNNDGYSEQQINGSNSEAKDCNNAVIKWHDNLLLEGCYSVSENEGEQEELAHQNSKIDMAFDDMMASKIVMEVEDVIAKEPITDMDDELTFQLWA